MLTLEWMRKRVGAPTAKSWLEPLQVIGFENGTLTYRATTKFIADWVESHYLTRLKSAWESVGYEVTQIQIESGKRNQAA